jgi:hypothetical protein
MSQIGRKINESIIYYDSNSCDDIITDDINAGSSGIPAQMAAVASSRHGRPAPNPGVHLNRRTFSVRAAQLLLGVAVGIPPATFGAGVNESSFQPIGGLDQWINIRGSDARNPVLLVVHGALGQIAKDGIEVAQYLCRTLQKRRIIVLGHSWGSIVGVRMLQLRPELFAAHVGTGQVASWKESVNVQFELLRAKAQRDGDSTAIKQFDAIGKPDPTNAQQYFTFSKSLRAAMAVPVTSHS